MMKQKLFFLFDKLKITRNERLAVMVIMLLLAGLALTQSLISRPSPFDKKTYQKLDKEFQKRTAVLKHKERTILARYQGKSSSEVAALNRSSEDTVKKEITAKTVSNHNSLININTAGLKELQKLPGIGPAYARRIIQYRNKNGAFKTTGDLLKIKGIGPATLRKIKSLISLGTATEKTGIPAASHAQSHLKTVSEKEAPASHSQININTADAQKLQTLPGVGAVYSQRIIAYRQKNGPFKTKNALLKIKGIGKKTLAKIKPFIKLRE
jgi:competence protein ComEA